jgi:putative oxidoreductase
MKDAILSIFRTDPDDWVATFLRLVLAGIILPHGLRHVMGYFGGPGLYLTIEYFKTLGIRPWAGYIALGAETVGAILLVFGLFTRVAALGIAAVFMVAAITVHMKFGYFMNWYGTKRGEGVEFFVLGIALALAVIARGGGAKAADAKIGTPKPIDYSMMGR